MLLLVFCCSSCCSKVSIHKLDAAQEDVVVVVVVVIVFIYFCNDPAAFVCTERRAEQSVRLNYSFISTTEDESRTFFPTTGCCRGRARRLYNGNNLFLLLFSVLVEAKVGEASQVSPDVRGVIEEQVLLPLGLILVAQASRGRISLPLLGLSLFCMCDKFRTVLIGVCTAVSKMLLF